jgi:hypothetical protein
MTAVTIVTMAVLGLSGCKDHAGDDEVPVLPQLELEFPYALIIEPTGVGVYTTTDATVLMGGPAMAQEVRWSSDRGSTGTTTGDRF